MIRDAIHANDFLKNLETFQVREIVSCMYPKDYERDEYIIKEGDTGDALFVISGNKNQPNKSSDKNQIVARLAFFNLKTRIAALLI